MHNKYTLGALLGAVVLGLSACVATDSQADGTTTFGPLANDAAFRAMVEDGFRPVNIATLDRLVPDDTQAFCSDPAAVNAPENADRYEQIAKANFDSIVWPTDGVFLGDYREGEKIAQSGRGMTWRDKEPGVNGGSCYNCHKISAEETSHGTIGPSLYQYGELRGYDEESIRYTWSQLWNSKSVNPCSNMPRFGHMGILTEDQIRHVMALLLDPDSPVNQ